MRCFQDACQIKTRTKLRMSLKLLNVRYLASNFRMLLPKLCQRMNEKRKLKNGESEEQKSGKLLKRPSQCSLDVHNYSQHGWISMVIHILDIYHCVSYNED